MSGYTIGDRVEVQWQGELFAATVIRIHEAEGACDAAYEIDGSVGMFLNAEEHGLKVLPDRPEKAEAEIAGARGNSVDHHCNGGNEAIISEVVSKRPPRLDKSDTEEVGSAPEAGGLAAHEQTDRGSIRKMCSTVGCSSFAQKNRLCKKHGDKCNTSGCTANVVARGVCTKHGANGLCSAQGCTTNVRARGLCHKHGANGLCAAKGCTANAYVRGVCQTHSANVSALL